MFRDVTPTVYFLAKSALLSASAKTVQMFPPGEQVVTPTSMDGSEPKELRLIIDETTAADLEALRATYQAKADAGEGDAPFFDFNHDDREASARPTRIFWAGSDPKDGGVRAEVEWTSAGEEAVQGKTFARFSPVFSVNEKAGKVTGAPINMGGLVNRAAFKTIAALAAKSSDSPESNPTPDPAMLTEEEIAALQAENAELKAKLEELTGKVEEMTVAAKEAKEADELAAKKAKASDLVDLAAKEGRIATAPEIKDKWVAAIVADEAAKDLLAAQAPNEALLTLVNGKATPPEDDTKKAKDLSLSDIIKAKREAAKG